MSDEDPSSLARLRTFLGATFVVGVVGSGTELLLIDHTEDRWQWVPLVLLAIGLAAFVVHLALTRLNRAAQAKWSRRVFGLVMFAFMAGGLWGLWLHYQGNLEFEREIFPSLGGFELFREAIRGATPALAPGTMVLLGLVGRAFVLCERTLKQATELPAPAVAPSEPLSDRSPL